MQKRPKKPLLRVSELFELGRSQPTLDFIDVNINGDTPVFLSPSALALLPSEWGDHCTHLIQNFFSTVLEHIKRGDHAAAEALLSTLREPNETHLGLSEKESRGHALGTDSAHDVWHALSTSGAAKSGLLHDLEDTVLMIDRIGIDIISDMTTNIIREPLISYTQEMAAQYGIPLTPDVNSGPLWNSKERKWFTRYERFPMTPTGKLLLVPKAIVRLDLNYDADEYYRHYLLEHLKGVELNAGSSLVQLLKNGNKRVTKKSLTEKYGKGKGTNVSETIKDPSILEDYRDSKGKEKYLPLDHEDIATAEGESGPNWEELLEQVLQIPAGKADSDKYEKAVEALLTALFYPDLTNPRPQTRIHDGRKRIDITYTNMGNAGFFEWIAKHYPSSQIMIECKNYKGEVANPELDQLSGRFSPSRGKVGFLICRDFDDKPLFIRRCKDTRVDDRGFIIPLDDQDLRNLVEERKSNSSSQSWSLLDSRFKELIN